MRPAWIALLCLLAACEAASVVPSTQVVVQISAGPSVRARATSLLVSFASGKGDPGSFAATGVEHFELDEDFLWPARMLLVPQDGDPERGFRILVEAREGQRTFLTARVISAFVVDKAVLLEMVLEDGCIDYTACSEQDTCSVQGGETRCVTAKRDSKDLPELTRLPELPGADAAMAAQSEAGPEAGQPHSEPADASQVDSAAMPRPEACGAEDCFNGIDDNCDLLTDCEDPLCEPSTVCVNGQEQVWLRLPGVATCPAGYIQEPETRHDELTSGPCSGCFCGNGDQPCTATIGLRTSCAADAPWTRAVIEANMGTCTEFPSGFSQIRLEDLTPGGPGGCPASGVAVPGELSWGKHATLCRPERTGGGCPAPSVCAPRTETGAFCRSGPSPCGRAERKEVWYSGYDNDTRSCGACGCVPSDQGCEASFVHYTLGECSLGGALVEGSVSECRSNLGSTVGIAMASLNCTAQSTLTGQALPAGGLTLCCEQ